MPFAENFGEWRQSAHILNVRCIKGIQISEGHPGFLLQLSARGCLCISVPGLSVTRVPELLRRVHRQDADGAHSSQDMDDSRDADLCWKSLPRYPPHEARGARHPLRHRY